MSDLPTQLRAKAVMIRMGEKIALWSECELMEQAAAQHEYLQRRIAELEATVAGYRRQAQFRASGRASHASE